MDLFPMIQPELTPEFSAAAESASLPLYKEAAWDFDAGKPVIRNGRPVQAVGLAAVKVWIYKALMTPRRLYEIYSWDFGSDVRSLVGQAFSADTKKAEAERYVREALEINPYIVRISNVQVNFDESKMTISARVETIYGEVRVLV